MLYSMSLLVIHFKYSRVYVSIPNSLTIPSPHQVSSIPSPVFQFAVLFFLTGGDLLYNIVLVSTIQQCESVIILYIYIYPSWRLFKANSRHHIISPIWMIFNSEVTQAKRNKRSERCWKSLYMHPGNSTSLLVISSWGLVQRLSL